MIPPSRQIMTFQSSRTKGTNPLNKPGHLCCQRLQQWTLAAALLIFGASAATEKSVGQSGPDGQTTKGPQTLALETYARRSFNYLNRMVDNDGLPYFNIFWTEPAEAAHDWPDFGDVMSRQLQAAVMGRHMTGDAIPIESTWRKKILELIEPESGLLTRPETSFSKKVADAGDQALTLYALVTLYADSPNEELRRIILRMTDGLLARAEKATAGDGGFLSGFMIKSLMVCARTLQYEPALKMAALQSDKVFNQSRLFTPDNSFKHGGHMHGNLRTLVGLADYALYVGDPVLFSRVDALYRYVRSETTRFGFLPEVIGRKGDVVATETCAIMDYIGLAVTLANHGHPEYWSDVERAVRNQLVESQARDLSWLKADPAKPDTEQFSWHDIADRMTGGWAGWSSPTHFLAACENLQWGGPELRGKTSLFQNCCGGSGTHALFIAWKNAARFENQTLSVHLHIDKLLPQAEIRGYQPWQGLLTVALKETCRVRVRIPDFIAPSAMGVESGGSKVPTSVFGNYLELGQRRRGEKLTITYPLPLSTEEIEIGNPEFQHYRYRVRWKGDTVVKMEPLSNEETIGYSDFDKKQVRVFYGKDGPGQLYQREAQIADQEPNLAPLHVDDGSLDFWARLSRSPQKKTSQGAQQ
jgi:hypothetical protein